MALLQLHLWTRIMDRAGNFASFGIANFPNATLILRQVCETFRQGAFFALANQILSRTFLIFLAISILALGLTAHLILEFASIKKDPF